jgi:hypothetical protein
VQGDLPGLKAEMLRLVRPFVADGDQSTAQALYEVSQCSSQSPLHAPWLAVLMPEAPGLWGTRQRVDVYLCV